MQLECCLYILWGLPRYNVRGIVQDDRARPNFKSVALTLFELLAFNAEKFRGSRDPGHAPFWKNFWGSCPDCPREDLRQI